MITIEKGEIITFSEDSGPEFNLEVLDCFMYENQEYVVLSDPEIVFDDAKSDTTHEGDFIVCIMKIVNDGEFEGFSPVGEDKLETLLNTWKNKCTCEEVSL